MSHQRLLELDALRGVAALSVVIFHYFFRYNELYGHQNLAVDWSEYGQFGVQFFFIISGFVIFWSLNRIEEPLDFIVSRFSRLYPVYWLSILITFSIVLIFGLPGREVSLGSALVNASMLQEYFKVPHVDGVYWTLTVELTFYFWIFILYLVSKLDWIEEIFLIGIVFSICRSLKLISIPIFVYKLFILKYLPLFLAGICFYKLVNSYNKRWKTILALLFSISSIAIIYSFKAFILFSCFYLVFYLAISGRLKLLTYRPLVFLGSISYSLYLLHQNIGYVIINKGYELGLFPLVSIFLAIFVAIALSTICTKYVEIPALKYIRCSYENKKSTIT